MFKNSCPSDEPSGNNAACKKKIKDFEIKKIIRCNDPEGGQAAFSDIGISRVNNDSYRSTIVSNIYTKT